MANQTATTTDVFGTVKSNILDALNAPVGRNDAEAIRDTVENGTENTWEVGLTNAGDDTPGLFVRCGAAPTKEGLAELIAGYVCEMLEVGNGTFVPNVSYIHRVA